MTTGIYEICHLASGKKYIGSAVNIEKRLSEHRRLLRHKRHYNRILQNAWSKYGEHAFVFSVRQRCSKEILITVEQLYVLSERPAYNIAYPVKSRFGYKKTEDEKRAQSERQKSNSKVIDHCRKMSAKAAALNKGKKYSLDHRKSIANSLLGKRHPPERVALQIGNKRGIGVRSSEVRKRMSDAAKVRWAKQKAVAAAGLSGVLKEVAHG